MADTQLLPDNTTQQRTTDLPSWAVPYVPNLLSSASTIAQQPYQVYGGQRFAGFNPLEKQAYTGIGGLGPAQQIGDASKMLSGAGIAAGNLGTNYANMATSPTAINAYMSPYMNNVVAQQQQGAIRDYARNIPGMGANAARVGGLGGTRNALVQAEGQRNLQNTLAGIQATGAQQAFQNAQQAQQFGSTLGLQGLQTQLGAGQALGGLGGQQFDQQLRALQAQQAGGAQMRGLEQQRLDAMYQDFLAQRGYPQEQANFMSNILKGGTTPAAAGTTTTTTSQSSPSIWNQILGGGLLYLADKYLPKSGG